MRTLYLSLALCTLCFCARAQTTLLTLPRSVDNYIWYGEQATGYWVLSHYYTITYNSRGQETERILFFGDFEQSKTINTYGNFGLLATLEQTMVSGGVWEDKSRTRYVYDQQGRLLTITNQAFNSASSQLENLTRVINTYTNDDLNPSSVERQIWSETLVGWGLEEKDINLVWSTDSNHPFKLLSYETQVVDFDLSWVTLKRHTNSYDPVTRTSTYSTDFASSNNS
ncbi:hypothetical protein [Rufibacter hautae]|uniref:YD repeat-containing protein n=1 Tax=Rufibacter hautae TaxID=2595005 RepID=A0A5B6TIN9_9BACT|nr:hypothetical protein [Rufibacter hautae]KAA3440534.1 hypothetical protein FOA19_07750 [Rufibacter hautae]